MKNKIELLSSILGDNKREKIQELLSVVDYSLHNLARFDLQHLIFLCKTYSLTKKDAIKLHSIFRLQEFRLSDMGTTTKIEEPSDLFNYFYHRVINNNYEESFVIFVNNSNIIIGEYYLSKGGLSSTVLDVRMILKQAIIHNATKIAVVHTHPSGCLNPSDSDIKITKTLNKACDSIGIPLLDHVIIGNSNYVSFADKGLLNI